MKYCKDWFLLLLLTLSLPCLADDIKSTPLPKKLVFCYTSHPTVDSVLLPLVKQAYQNLGIKTEFVSVGTQRAQQLLQEGQVDGDVARISAITSRVPSAVLVTLLDKLSLSLRCQPDVHCKAEDINDPGLRIFIATARSTLTFLDLRYKAELYIVRDWNQINVMYQQKKIDRFLWIEGTLASSPIVDGADVVPLDTKPLDLYHVLHKSHTALVPLVAEQLELLLAAHRAGQVLAVK